MNRVYATGQSASSSLTSSLAVANCERLAAVFPSNSGTPTPVSGGLPIPSLDLKTYVRYYSESAFAVDDLKVIALP